MSADRFTLARVEDRLWLATAATGLAAYDLDFASHFACRHPFRLDREVTAVARMGAAEDYAARFESLLQTGVRLIHSPAQYRLTSLLPEWYPLLSDLTPRTRCYEEPPTARQVGDEFGWPVFLKGERQTSRHDAAAAVARDAGEFERAMGLWRADPILRWQRVVARQHVPLRPASDVPAAANVLPASFEFRTFWWRGRPVGFGRYWTSHVYAATDAERAAALAVALEAARRLDVPFVAVDVAQAGDGRWWVIEPNDAQDCGYAGVAARAMWRRVFDAERPD